MKSMPELRGGILLGTNVLNAWRFTISRRLNKMYFTEDIGDVPNKHYVYANYFKPETLEYAYLENRIIAGIDAIPSDRTALTITSMAARDNIIAGESYFIAEIKSLKRTRLDKQLDLCIRMW